MRTYIASVLSVGAKEEKSSFDIFQRQFLNA
jgi:hypothetical protein